MQTLTPTKDTGATAKANEVVYVELDQTETDQGLATQLSLDGVNAAFVADFLSACLTHERCGTHLYRSVAGRTLNPMLQGKYQQFGRQTVRHVEILEDVIVAGGGNPSYVSPLARATEAADTKALEATYLGSGGLDPMAAEMAMLDAVFMAETVDHANWEALGQLAAALPDGAMKDALTAAGREVEEDEDEHLSWAAGHPSPADDAAGQQLHGDRGDGDR
jgi:rubrerythrin